MWENKEEKTVQVLKAAVGPKYEPAGVISPSYEFFKIFKLSWWLSDNQVHFSLFDFKNYPCLFSHHFQPLSNNFFNPVL